VKKGLEANDETAKSAKALIDKVKKDLTETVKNDLPETAEDAQN